MRRVRPLLAGCTSHLVQLNAALDDAIELAAKVDLGRKPYTGDCSIPSPATPKVYYPTIWIDDRETPVDLPVSGKAVIDYKVVSRTARERDGKTKHDATIEIQSIEALEKKGRKDGRNGTDGTNGKAVPVKLSAIVPGMIRFSRARNSDGEFAPEAGGGPDPATMRAAYGSPNVVKGMGAAAGLGGTAAAALLIARRMKGRSAK